MAKARAPRTVVTPRLIDLADGGGSAVSVSKLSFWKHILPERSIDYTDDETGETRVLDFNSDYLDDLALAFESKAIDDTAFMLADKDNAHTMDPDRWRGSASQMVREDKLPEDVKAELVQRHGEVPRGLYAKLDFATKRDAKAVLRNPKLGVSARIREGFKGKPFRNAIIHVLGTLDPKVPGMAHWTPAVDLSEYAADDVLDLSNATYKETTVAKNKTKTVVVPEIDDVDPDDIKDWDDATLAAFLDEHADLIDGDDDDEDSDDDDEGSDDDDDDDDDEEPGREVAPGVPAPETAQREYANLSKSQRRTIDLANAQARESQRTAREALSRVAEAEWRAERQLLLGKGVPPHVVDLAAPLLRGADDNVIDLSHQGGPKKVNASDIVRKLVENFEGTIDLSEVDLGHSDAPGNSDRDAALAAEFERMTEDYI